MRAVAEMFSAVGESNRLRILNLLASRGEICVCDLTKVLDVPQARVSRHLTTLRHAGLVSQRREGTWVVYALAEPQSGLQAALVDSLREHLPDDRTLAADLRTFDRLKKTGALTRCPKECKTR